MTTQVPVAARPEPLSSNPLRRIGGDLVHEFRSRGSFPPGPSRFSMRRTTRFLHDPLSLLLGCYEEYGPVFSMRLFHERFVFMLGPEANRFVFGNSELFEMEQAFQALVPVDGPTSLIVSDGEDHKRRRRLVQPALVHRQIEIGRAHV